MALITTEAIVLKSLRWGEADRIVTFFSFKLGKVRTIARGARKMKSRFGGALEPFTYVNITLFDKRNDSLASLNTVDIIESHASLRENLKCIMAAARMVSFVDGIAAERDPSSELFHILRYGLQALIEAKDYSLATLIFQIHVLTHSGFCPQIDHCASCGKMFGSMRPRFSPMAGGLLCQVCDQTSWDYCLTMSSGSVEFVKRARCLRFELALRLKAVGQVRRELEYIIDTYVRSVVCRPLPAIDFLTSESVSIYSTVKESSIVERVQET